MAPATRRNGIQSRWQHGPTVDSSPVACARRRHLGGKDFGSRPRLHADARLNEPSRSDRQDARSVGRRSYSLCRIRRGVVPDLLSCRGARRKRYHSVSVLSFPPGYSRVPWIRDSCAEHGIQFVSDEVFHPIYHGPETDSAARLSCATVVGDFSKALSLPGLRLGWIVERDGDRRREYLNAREYLTVSNTPMGEFLGEIAISHHDQVLARTRKVASTNLALLESVIAKHADIVDWVRPQGGMTGFARLASGGNARLFCEAALENGLLLAPGECWGIPDYFRIGFGVGREWYPDAMGRLSGLLCAWSRAA